METIKINGVEFNNFGSNNYSEGMLCITSTPKQLGFSVKEMIQKILNNEFFGVWLNPSAPCNNEEFYGVFGTDEQYRKLYQNQKECQISAIAVRKLGGLSAMLHATKEEHDKADKEASEEYIDWWLK